MAQSVELLLDPAAEAAVRAQWKLLGRNSGAERPHLTLFAATRLDAALEPALRELFGELDLPLVLGALTIFGPHRETCILVRQVCASAELLALQTVVAQICSADPHGQFGPGRWSPHVTLARRVLLGDLGGLVALLGPAGGAPLGARVTLARRWDGNGRREWSISPTQRP